MPVYILSVSAFAALAELSSCTRDHVAYKVKSVYSDALLKKFADPLVRAQDGAERQGERGTKMFLLPLHEK